MHRIDTPTAQVDKFGLGKNGFTRGNPQTGTPATELDDDYFDMIQEELAKVVEATGVELDKEKHDQLLTALKYLFQSKDATLTAIAALVTSADKLPYFTGVDTTALTDLTNIGRNVIGQTSIANLLAYLNLGTAAQRNVGTGTNQIPDMNSFAFTTGNPLNYSLPGGLILKAGNGATSTANVTINFASAFPNTCIAGGVLSVEESTDDYAFGQCISRGAGSIVLSFYRNASGSAPRANTAAITYSWLAIGY